MQFIFFPHFYLYFLSPPHPPVPKVTGDSELKNRGLKVGDKLLKLAGGSSCDADFIDDVLVEHRGDDIDAREAREAPEQPGNSVFLSNPSTR